MEGGGGHPFYSDGQSQNFCSLGAKIEKKMTPPTKCSSLALLLFLSLFCSSLKIKDATSQPISLACIYCDVLSQEQVQNSKKRTLRATQSNPTTKGSLIISPHITNITSGLAVGVALMIPILVGLFIWAFGKLDDFCGQRHEGGNG